MKAFKTKGSNNGRQACSENEMQSWLIGNGFIECNDGKLCANFPVFDSLVYEGICKMLAPVCKTVADCMIGISDKAEEILIRCRSIPFGKSAPAQNTYFTHRKNASLRLGR